MIQFYDNKLFFISSLTFTISFNSCLVYIIIHDNIMIKINIIDIIVSVGIFKFYILYFYII